MTGPNQEFHAAVSGGVAARDVHNEAPRTSIHIGAIHGGQNVIGHTGDIYLHPGQHLWHLSTRELKSELVRCPEKLRQFRKGLFFNVPFLWLAAWLVCTVWLVGSGLWLKYLGSVWMFAWVLSAVMIPLPWLIRIRQGRGRMIAHYVRRIEIIDTILLDRK